MNLFAGLFDDAAIFPPGNAPMPAAWSGHRAHRRGPHAELVGHFLCADVAVDEMRAALATDPDPEPVAVALVVRGPAERLPAAIAAVRVEPRLRLTGVELAIPDADQATVRQRLDWLAPHLPDQAPVAVELPSTLPDAALFGALDAVAGHPHRTKLRTGGTVASAFPDEDAVARFISAAVRRSVPFKCTAGLHHAVRHRDPATGFEHHGFLNILLATHDALGGADPAQLSVTLAERDGSVLAKRAGDLSGPQARAIRDNFVALGTCSIEEPVADLRELGLSSTDTGLS